jgi:hydrogenase maturation protein HypF
VGFRPFVYQLARRCGLTGYVVNTPVGVDVEVEGPKEELERFFAALRDEPPPLAHISAIERIDDLPPEHRSRFEIRESRTGEARSALISPDVSVCGDCLRELENPRDRRYRYPFINCTNCGPRYTIIQDIPYDRPLTTMGRFVMCAACRAEYEDPEDRRFHAQPNACPRCGPRLALHDAAGNPLACDDPLEETIRRLRAGEVLAVKGLGGFHLAVDAARHDAVSRLRRRKHREEKPFALMVAGLEAARSLARIAPEDAEALTSIQRPIVLVEQRDGHGLSPEVAPRNRFFGLMLPYTPLHHLLLREGGFRALVMTSGNLSEEPITIANEDAFLRLRGVADAFLVHDRDIHLRSDDSIVRVVGGVPRQIRRSRGFVPAPVFLHEDLSALPPVLAVGGELKNTVCLTKENRAFVSQHVGDMENLETLDFFRLTVCHLERILEIEPRVLACDLHPDYLGSRYARERGGLPRVEVQHHHAHIVSVLAENRVQGPVIGIALDGTGLGDDGTVWGGELLLADPASYRRAAWLQPAPLPGGDAAARFPRRMALSYLHRAFGEGLFDLAVPFVRDLDRKEAELVVQMVSRGVRSPLTSSCGRLFDAVSALLGIRGENRYEGQAPMELEAAQDEAETGRYPWESERLGDGRVLMTDPLLRAVVGDLAAGLSPARISRRFHNTLVRMLAEMCRTLREETGLHEVALGGGSFQNVTLFTGLHRALTEDGFTVHTHAQVPTNDGGLSLGQAVSAAVRFAQMGSSLEF